MQAGPTFFETNLLPYSYLQNLYNTILQLKSLGIEQGRYLTLEELLQAALLIYPPCRSLSQQQILVLLIACFPQLEAIM
ncbi:MAG: hypothetical protein NZ576_01940 [Bacteroidia bacterium]|nr:hypothetical protein [Bacteroidia bacterium]